MRVLDIGKRVEFSRWQFFIFIPLLFSIFSLSSPTVHAEDIRDVRPPVDVPGSTWWLWIAAIVCVAALVFVVAYLMRTFKAHKAVAAPKASWEIAYERLAELERQNLFAQGRVKDYYVALSDITRRYIEGRFDIQAPDMTTEEFLNSLKSNPLIEHKHKDILKQFLTLSDMVKFAKYGPNASEAKESLGLAKRFVDETKIKEDVGVQDAV